MHNTNNKKVLSPLIKRFEELSKQPFSKKREYAIDDLFAELLRTKLSAGTKKFDDSIHRDVRIRSFRYQSDDGRCGVTIEVKMFLGQSSKTEFIANSIFRKIPKPKNK